MFFYIYKRVFMIAAPIHKYKIVKPNVSNKIT